MLKCSETIIKPVSLIHKWWSRGNSEQRKLILFSQGWSGDLNLPQVGAETDVIFNDLSPRSSPRFSSDSRLIIPYPLENFQKGGPMKIAEKNLQK